MKRSFHAGRSLGSGLSLNILTPDEMEEIHLGTLEILHHVGLFIEHNEALDLFEEGGATVDRKKKMVKIPPYMVEEAIQSAPPKVFLAGRDPEHDIVLESTRVHFTNFSEGVQVVDPLNGEKRPPVKKDLEDAARVIDYLDEVDFCEKAIGAHDVPQEVVPLHNAEAFLTHTTKHCAFGPGNAKFLKMIMEMGAVIAGGEEEFQKRPLVSFTTCPVSPLKLISECCEIIVESARSGMVCNILSMAMAGGTSPVTLAGTLVTHNAEILGGITLSQLARKGAPVIYGSSTTAMDLRLGTASIGTPEAAMISGAVAQLARFYKVPSYVGGT
jgi:trimethylamine--corrinoid protein Co-methyltransferase